MIDKNAPHIKHNPQDIWNSSFMGIGLVQAWQDLMLWEAFIDRVNPGLILELGTFTGGMSVFLALHCKAYSAKFLTFDFVDYLDMNNKMMIESGVVASYRHLDIFVDQDKVLSELRGAEDPNRPTIFFCDDGNKPREFQTFVPHLRSGDYVAVHDFGTEFNTLNDVAPVANLVEEFMTEECDALKSMTRFYKRM